MPELLFVSLGSNIEPEKKLYEAIRRLGRVGRLVSVSTVYQNPAVGPQPQADYLNAAALLETDLPLEKLRAVLRQIERELGRRRSDDKYAPRTIDLDISFKGDAVVDSDQVHIPDPDILERGYLAVTLAELSPDFRHPITGQSLAAIANGLRQHTSLTVRSDVTTQLRSLVPSPSRGARPSRRHA